MSDVLPTPKGGGIWLHNAESVPKDVLQPLSLRPNVLEQGKHIVSELAAQAAPYIPGPKVKGGVLRRVSITIIYCHNPTVRSHG